MTPLFRLAVRNLPWFALVLAFLPITVTAGLRDIRPRPQQMGLISDEPVCLDGSLYLVIPDNATAEEIIVRDEAVRLLQERVSRTVNVLPWSSYAGESPTIWMGTASRFPALIAALDSTAIGGLGTLTHTEEYQIYVEDLRIFLAGYDLRGLRWGLVSLVQLMAVMNGRVFVDRAFIRDWPDFPKRIATINSPIRNQDQSDYCHQITDLAYGAKMNEIEWNDGDASIGSRSSYTARLARDVRGKMSRYGMALTASADATAIGVPEPSWQEAVPIDSTMMRVTSTGFAPIANGYGVSTANGGFELWSGSRPTDWTVYRDDRWAYVTRDATTKHSGQYSVKFSGMNSSTPPDIDFRQFVCVGPHRLLKVKFWYKTSGFNGQIRCGYMGPAPVWGGLEMTVPLNPPDNSDWTYYEKLVCTFYADTVFLLFGPMYATAGTLWLDDLTFETADIQELVRRSDTPVAVYKHRLNTLMTEGVDYGVIETYSQAYSQFVKRPRFDNITGGRLNLNDTVKVNWHCAFLFQGSRQTNCFSLLDPLTEYAQRLRALDSLLYPDGFKIHINEVSYTNYDPTCANRQRSCGELVGGYCRLMYQAIQARRWGAPVRIYGDPFDIHVFGPRAMPVTSLPWQVGALQELPAAVEMMAMVNYSTNIESTFTYYAQNHHPSVMAVALWESFQKFVDASIIARRFPDCRGTLCYMWQGDCGTELEWRMREFGCLGWNLGPYILHAPPALPFHSDSIQIFAEMWSDTLHSTPNPSLSTTRMDYRLLPNGSWTSANLTRMATDRYSVTIRPIGPEVIGIEYYLTTTDHRLQTSTAPADAPTRTYVALFDIANGMIGPERNVGLSFDTRFLPGATLIEWPTDPDAAWYDVHRGTPPDFREGSSTRVARQSPLCPRFMILHNRYGSVNLDEWSVYSIHQPKRSIIEGTVLRK